MKRKRLAVWVWLALLLLPAGAEATGRTLRGRAPARLGPGEGPPLGRPGHLPSLRVDDDGTLVDLPLKETDVFVEVSGLVARATVSQRFENPLTQPLEAIYVFPLPQDAAVDGYRLEVEDRVIEGVVKAREEAVAEYRAAREAGHTAGLLTQERPNVFTQRIANLPPGESVRVEVRYVQPLAFDEGVSELVVPMVVAPRYAPGAAPGTAEGPDRPVHGPPVVADGLSTGHRVSVFVRLDAGAPVQDLWTPSHDVESAWVDGDLVEVRTRPEDDRADRDFILRWRVAGARPTVVAQAHRDGAEGTLALSILPPAQDLDAVLGPRELIFVVDVSGSMRGLPLWLCKEAMRSALERLRPSDTFNVLTFSGFTRQAFAAPRPASGDALAEALRVVDGLSAGGGTELGQAVAAALQPAVEPERSRYVFFLTDGFVGQEAPIFSEARAYVEAHDRDGRRARVFALGIGSAPNRHLIEGLAEAGRGLAVYASNREDPVRGVDRFFRAIGRPVLEDVRVTFEGAAEVHDPVPPVVPDLFASRPVTVLGRYTGHGPTTAVVSARQPDGRPFRLRVLLDLPAKDRGHGAIETLWARARVQALLGDLAAGGGRNRETVRAEGVRLGVDHGIVTPWTAFVAVDRSRTVPGELLSVVQPVEAPEDVDVRAAGGLVAGPRGAARGIPGAMAPASGSAGALGSAVGVGGMGASGVTPLGTGLGIGGMGGSRAPGAAAPRKKLLRRGLVGSLGGTVEGSGPRYGVSGRQERVRNRAVLEGGPAEVTGVFAAQCGERTGLVLESIELPPRHASRKPALERLFRRLIPQLTACLLASPPAFGMPVEVRWYDGPSRADGLGGRAGACFLRRLGEARPDWVEEARVRLIWCGTKAG